MTAWMSAVRSVSARPGAGAGPGDTGATAGVPPGVPPGRREAISSSSISTAPRNSVPRNATSAGTSAKPRAVVQVCTGAAWVVDGAVVFGGGACFWPCPALPRAPLTPAASATPPAALVTAGPAVGVAGADATVLTQVCDVDSRPVATA